MNYVPFDGAPVFVHQLEGLRRGKRGFHQAQSHDRIDIVLGDLMHLLELKCPNGDW